MPLNIKVEGVPGSIRATGSWLRTLETNVHNVGTDVYQARGTSESDWIGPAGDGFRGVMTEFGTGIDTLATDCSGTAGALDTHAGDLDGVIRQMGNAAGIAREAGLTVTDTTIEDPGPAPANPAPLPTDREPTTTEQSAFDSANTAQETHAQQVAAYQQASEVVTQARTTETNSQNHLLRFVRGYASNPLSYVDFAAGYAGAHAARTSALRATAGRYNTLAARAANLADGQRLTNLSGAARQNWIRAAQLEASFTVRANQASAAATAGRVSRLVDRLPGGVTRFLSDDFTFRGTINQSTRFLGRATPVLRRVPVVGTLLTGVGIYSDIQSGKNPTQSIAAGVGGLAAGAATGAAIGSLVPVPIVGTVAGAIVGAGVSYAISEWGDEVAGGVADAAGAVTDFGGDVIDGIGGLFD